MNWEQRMAERAATRAAVVEPAVPPLIPESEYLRELASDEYAADYVPAPCACMGCPLHVDTSKCWCQLRREAAEIAQGHRGLG